MLSEERSSKRPRDHESSYFLTFVYLPPAGASPSREVLYERSVARCTAREVLRGLSIEHRCSLIEGFMPECRWLDDQETLTYLHATISSKRHRVRVPEFRCISTRCSPISLDSRT